MRVSCLMVTMPTRRTLMARALRAFRAQSHGTRELVVVIDQGTEGDRAAAASMLAGEDVAVVRPDRPMPLGVLRNLAVTHARGEVLCQWDDDDLHHPERIARQLAALTAAGADAAILRDTMQLDASRGTMTWTNWAKTPAGGHPGTLICRRAAMPAYPDIARGEDLALLERLAAPVHAQPDEPHLYVYVTHGANSMSAGHHAMLAERLGISAGLLRRREAAIRAGLAPFGLAGVRLSGPNGDAFTL